MLGELAGPRQRQGSRCSPWSRADDDDDDGKTNQRLFTCIPANRGNETPAAPGWGCSQARSRAHFLFQDPFPEIYLVI